MTREHTATDEPRLAIEPFALGPFETNCYIVRAAAGSAQGREHAPETGFVVDCGQDPEPLLDRLDELNLTPEVWLLTHAHIDHIAGLNRARRRFPDVPIWIHRIEESWLLDAEANLSAFTGQPITGPPADRLLDDEQQLTLAGLTWTTIHVPGHSPGSLAYHNPETDLCFGGDALFRGSIGRTDFPGCDFETLATSIRTRLYTLPDETRVLPGHGPDTTIAGEKHTNPFVTAS